MVVVVELMMPLLNYSLKSHDFVFNIDKNACIKSKLIRIPVVVLAFKVVDDALDSDRSRVVDDGLFRLRRLFIALGCGAIRPNGTVVLLIPYVVTTEKNLIRLKTLLSPKIIT